MTEAMPTGSPPPTGTIDGSSQNAVTEARKPTAPTAYAPVSPIVAISTPPKAGPMTAPTLP